MLDRALEEELPADIKVDVKGEGGRVIRVGMMTASLINYESSAVVESAGFLNWKLPSERKPESII